MPQQLMDNQFETVWLQIRGSLRDKWRNLSQEDVDQINGSYDLLVSKLQQRYGYSRDQAEEYIQNWVSEKVARLSPQEGRFSSFSKEGSSSPSRPEEGQRVGSLWRWIFGIGIPLLLILSYFNTREASSTPSSPSTPRTAMPTASPLAGDRLMADTIRMALISNSAIAPDLAAVRITSLNGVVTLSGSVPSQEQSDRIYDAVRNLSGVRQVDNQLIVR